MPVAWLFADPIGISALNCWNMINTAAALHGAIVNMFVIPLGPENC